VIRNKIFLFFIIIFICLGINQGKAQIRKDEAITFSGVIEKVDKNFKFIIVNERIIMLSNMTKIADENGNPLQKSNLKRNTLITIEAIHNPVGFLANNITIKISKR
ncbi:MAG: hypothetical protein ACUVT6_08045, partial [Thermodesulfobacteriota bacterium]